MFQAPHVRHAKFYEIDILSIQSFLSKVFGNASEDMRVVLTWRKLDRNNPKRNGRWKLRQSSITKLDDDDSLENLDFLDGGSRKDSKG